MRKLSILPLIACLLFGLNAQSQSLKATTQKIKTLHNVSFTEIVKFKFSFQDEFSIDTLHTQMTIAAGEPQIGGYYKIKGDQDIYLFDGNKSIILNLRDTTYHIAKDAVNGQFNRSLLYWQKEIERYLKSPSKIKQLKDTLINKVAYDHFVVTLKDTIQKNEKIHDIINIITDKKTKLPFAIKSDFKGFAEDGALLGVVEQHTFKDYKTNDKNFPDLSEIKIPENFKLPVPKVKLAPLSVGIKAPYINLHDATGNTFDLDKLQGKVVLLNFALLDCPHCINSAQMLARLNEKYNHTNFEIISIYQLRLDNQTAISKFDSKFNIKYPSYTTENSAEKLYHVQGYPNFFLIDKQGNIAQGYEGFYAALEKELIAKIDSIK